MKDFLIIGNHNARFYKDIWEYTRQGIIHLGYTYNNYYPEKHFLFDAGDGGVADLQLVARWLTNIPVDNPHKPPFTEDKTVLYQEFDNYKGIINVDKCNEVPKYYPGEMGVPTSVLKYNLDDYDIIGKIENGKVNGVAKYRRIVIRKKMKDHIILANKNTLFWGEVFPLYMKGTIRFGYTKPNNMYLPDYAEKYVKIENGRKITNLQGCGRWITNLPVEIEYRKLMPIAYNDTDFQPYDIRTDIINTDSIDKIPDTDKLIGVPIGIVDYPIENYEIIGKMKTGKGDYDLGKPLVQGKEKYVRVVIKKQSPKKGV